MDTDGASMMLSWTRLPCSFSLTTRMLWGIRAGSLPPTAASSGCGIMARTRPWGVVSDCTSVISPPKRVVSDTVPGNFSEALKKMLAMEFSAKSFRAKPCALCFLPISFIVAVKSTTIRRKGVLLPVARIMRSLKFMAQR